MQWSLCQVFSCYLMEFEVPFGFRLDSVQTLAVKHNTKHLSKVSHYNKSQSGFIAPWHRISDHSFKRSLLLWDVQYLTVPSLVFHDSMSTVFIDS